MGKHLCQNRIGLDPMAQPHLTPLSVTQKIGEKPNKKGQRQPCHKFAFFILVFVPSFAAPKPILDCL